MKRRAFVSLLGGAVAAWPLAARAQQRGGMRRIGVFLPGSADDPEYQARTEAFRQGLAELGWSDGGNVRIDTRWGSGEPTAIANTRPNWLRSCRTSSWLRPPWSRRRCSGRPAACRSMRCAGTPQSANLTL